MDSRYVQGWLFFFSSALMVVAVVFSARQVLQLDLQPWGDVAADMLLVRKITEDGYLLTGHYSRFGFNHPGPFFFYISFFAERLFMPLGITQFGAWVLSACLINMACVLLAGWFLAQLRQSRALLPALASVMLPLCLPGDEIFNPWIPCRLYLPYMAFLCSLLVIAQGNWRCLPLSVLLACMLIHGYVTLPLFTLVPLAVACAYAYRRVANRSSNQRPFLYVSLIALVFALPIVGDVILNARDNTTLIFSAAKMYKSTAWDFSAALALLGSFWRQSLLLLLPLLVIWLLAMMVARSGRVIELLLQGLALALFISALFVVYHANAPPPLFEFVAYFYRGLVFAMMALLMLSSLMSIDAAIARNTLVVLLLVLELVVVANKAVRKPVSDDFLRDLSAALLQRHESQLRIDYAEDEMWTYTAGIVYNLRQAGADACVARPALRHMFTENATCKEPAQYLVINAQDCLPGDCIIAAQSLALKKLF